ncbi:MAG TPA: radical SAM family heme chaperone HemW [Saprospiraceae bacterium]|nr:radical SAM family heme chaperone HemW [Saprospiraceae bacterium]
MAGIYIHIPFCKQACSYCDFHFSTSLKLKDDFLKALDREIDLRGSLLNEQVIETIYFGGGTPSILSSAEIEGILAALDKRMLLDKVTEITLEANPDDVSYDKFRAFQKAGINRLSLGIQSFHEDDLHYMHRAHTSQEGIQALEIIDALGYKTISVDLIYGSPTTTDEMLVNNVELVANFSNVNHLSAYALTVEDRTPLKALIKRGMKKEVNEEQQVRQFYLLKSELEKRSFVHYEISNYGKDGQVSRHNTSYWFHEPYLGLGPSAHSFLNHRRLQNIANNKKYIDLLNKKEVPCFEEILSPTNKYNEYVLIALRTMWGIDVNHIHHTFPQFESYFMNQMSKLLDDGQLFKVDNHVKLSKESLIYADLVAMSLFVDD